MQTQITIHDFQTHVGPNSGPVPFRWWVSFSVAGEELYDISRNWVVGFAELANHLVAKGEFDGYSDGDENGSLFLYEYPDGSGKCNSYTFDEVIKEFMLSGDLDHVLEEFVGISLQVIEDLLLESAA